MRCTLTRRQVIRIFCLSIPAALLTSKGFRSEDEHICVHVYALNELIPAPLIQNRGERVSRSPDKEYFQSSLPEFLFCTSKVRFLHLFEYFWPISDEEFRRMREQIEVKLAKLKLSDEEIVHFSLHLQQQDPLSLSQGMTSSVVLTLNDYTIQWVSEIVQICRKNNIKELVIFKDPSKPPYLCSYPARQKGFRRPPPIGSNSS